jgi:histidinol-phosphate/aromatic aminotransferase/cobyric acid decarboxylase-like protein
MCAQLQKQGVLLRDRAKDISPGLVRVSIGTQKEMERLLKLIKRYR